MFLVRRIVGYWSSTAADHTRLSRSRRVTSLSSSSQDYLLYDSVRGNRISGGFPVFNGSHPVWLCLPRIREQPHRIWRLPAAWPVPLPFSSAFRTARSIQSGMTGMCESMSVNTNQNMPHIYLLCSLELTALASALFIALPFVGLAGSLFGRHG